MSKQDENPSAYDEIIARYRSKTVKCTPDANNRHMEAMHRIADIMRSLPRHERWACAETAWHMVEREQRDSSYVADAFDKIRHGANEQAVGAVEAPASTRHHPVLCWLRRGLLGHRQRHRRR